MDRITVDEDIVRHHSGTLVRASGDLVTQEQRLDDALDLGESEPYSSTDPGVEYLNALTTNLSGHLDQVERVNDHLLRMAVLVRGLADEATAVDEDVADQLRALADRLDDPSAPAAVPVTPVPTVHRPVGPTPITPTPVSPLAEREELPR